MKIEELCNVKAPFDVVPVGCKRKVTVIGFSRNDPLGVGGGLFPDMPTVYFKGGGWVLLTDFIKHYEIAKE